MSISIAQFTQWLRDQASKVTVLAELAFAYQKANVLAGYLSVPAANANSGATQPDSASNSITSDITIELDVMFSDYTNRQTIAFKYDGLTNNRAWYWQVLAGGTMRWQSSPDGIAAPNNDSTATLTAAGAAAGARHIFRISHQMNDGAGHNVVTPEFSDNGGASWTPIGAPIINAGTQAGIFDSNAIVNLIGGTAEFASDGARVYAFRIYSGVGVGKVLKQNLDYTSAANGAASVADQITGAWATGADSSVVNGPAYTPTESLIYLADRPFVTGPTDTPPNTSYRDVIDAAPEFTRSIDLANLGGRGTIALGALELNNADGSLDFLFDAITDGREIRFYAGDAAWARADFRLIGSGVVSSIKADSDTRITLALKDKSSLLDAAIAGEPITTGPNVGKSKPVVLGSVANLDLAPYLIDTTGPTYAINNRPLNTYNAADPPSPLETAPVAAVRDSGVALEKTTSLGVPTANAATDTITWPAAHGLAVDDVFYMATNVFPGMVPYRQYWVLASGLTATDWKFSATRGGSPVDITGTVLTPVNGSTGLNPRRYYVDAAAANLKLSATPSGRVTADVIGSTLNPNVGGPSFYGAFMPIPYYGFRYVLDTFTKLTAGDRDDAAFDALQNSIVLNSAWGVAVLSRTNVMDVLDGIVLMTNAWYGWNAQGKLTVGKLDLANLDSAVAIDSISQEDMDGDPSCENLQLPFGKVIANGGPNAAVQTDGLATSVSPFNRGKWGQPYQLQTKTTDTGGSAYSTNWWLYHKTAADAAPVTFPMTVVFDGSGNPVVTDVQAACDERTRLFRPWIRIFRCTVGLDKYQYNPGDCITAKYPRYGMSAGKKFRVMSVKTRASDRKCDLVLARQSIPDSQTSSHA